MAYHEPGTEPPLGKRLLAEFVGTLLLVAVGAGAATAFLLGPQAAFRALPQGLQDVPDNQATFGALLGNTGADILPVALAFAAILAVLVYAFGGVSGGHFNPAVTFALALSNRFKWAAVVPYWVAQILGGIAGGFIVAALFKNGVGGVEGKEVLFGATAVAEGVDWPQALLAEAFIGFFLMTAIMAVAVDPRAPKGWSGLIIGLALAGGIFVTAPLTGGSANFARSLGPLVASLAFGGENIPWDDLVWYAAGPVIGAAAAALVYEGVTSLRTHAPAPAPGAATSDGYTTDEEARGDIPGDLTPPPPPPAP
ncbi:MAG: aquaporin [Actinobacteria bacterium]|nr:aquaporin [Actinomycetota bacterium]